MRQGGLLVGVRMRARVRACVGLRCASTFARTMLNAIAMVGVVDTIWHLINLQEVV